MSLAIDYCKEIAKQLQQTAVYIPGASVNPGDIIKFKSSDRKPLGEFHIRGNLKDLGIDLETVTEKEDQKDSYVYASKGSVSISFEADASGGDSNKGKLNIGFSKEGSVYLSAVDCLESRFKSIIGLEDRLEAHREKLDWSSLFIVISVTTAAKALIMQSNTNTASLEITGSVKSLIPGADITKDINANLGLKISKYKEASFMKDWSDNVPVFMTVVRYRKKFLGGWDFDSKRLTSLLREKASSKENPFIIEVIDPNSLDD